MVDSWDLNGDQLSSQIMTLFGTTTGAGGTFSLTSDQIVTPQTSIVLPKGTTLKIRSRLVAGSAVIVQFRFANDGATFRELTRDVLGATGGTPNFTEVDDELRTAHFFRSSNGTEAIQIAYTGGASGGTFATMAFLAEFIQDRM
jgi:hypothetical protein